MAVQNSDGDSKQPVEEGVLQPSCREPGEVGQFGPIQPKKSNQGPSICSEVTFSQKVRCNPGEEVIRKDTRGMVKSSKRRKRNKDNESDSLSDIDDAEVSRYLNSTKEIQYKRILWEAMYGKHTQVTCQTKKQKRKTETKKVVPVKEVAKATKKVEVQKRSSRINYDALKLLNDELEKGSETGQVTAEETYAHRTDDSSYRNINNGSDESNYDEDQNDISSYEDNITFGDGEDETYYENVDEYLDEEYSVF